MLVVKGWCQGRSFKGEGLLRGLLDTKSKTFGPFPRSPGPHILPPPSPHLAGQSHCNPQQKFQGFHSFQVAFYFGQMRPGPHHPFRLYANRSAVPVNSRAWRERRVDAEPPVASCEPPEEDPQSRLPIQFAQPLSAQPKTTQARRWSRLPTSARDRYDSSVGRRTTPILFTRPSLIPFRTQAASHSPETHDPYLASLPVFPEPYR
ncbi:hypothetical protein MSAN_00350400 [Mycena sanguinolenta]|uniref:Uncharacterized protein n=1 Tax=Mycena sanguinolenta TaxID=230812 RepID=A0A8H6Z8U2_9AGAR|nr:hypothetical protein MSAN_00350400 [Mycena sanguinolenta]